MAPARKALPGTRKHGTHNAQRAWNLRAIPPLSSNPQSAQSSHVGVQEPKWKTVTSTRRMKNELLQCFRDHLLPWRGDGDTPAGSCRRLNAQRHPFRYLS
eukprot:13945889-Alexandrium_andersonii.AAC.1